MHAAKPTAGPRSKVLYNGCNENDTRSHDRGASGREALYAPPKLAASRVFCSNACALEEPVAGLAALDRFTVTT